MDEPTNNAADFTCPEQRANESVDEGLEDCLIHILKIPWLAEAGQRKADFTHTVNDLKRICSVLGSDLAVGTDVPECQKRYKELELCQELHATIEQKVSNCYRYLFNEMMALRAMRGDNTPAEEEPAPTPLPAAKPN